MASSEPLRSYVDSDACSGLTRDVETPRTRAITDVFSMRSLRAWMFVISLHADMGIVYWFLLDDAKQLTAVNAASATLKEAVQAWPFLSFAIPPFYVGGTLFFWGFVFTSLLCGFWPNGRGRRFFYWIVRRFPIRYGLIVLGSAAVIRLFHVILSWQQNVLIMAGVWLFLQYMFTHRWRNQIWLKFQEDMQMMR